jgi:hypothetical protein
MMNGLFRRKPLLVTSANPLTHGAAGGLLARGASPGIAPHSLFSDSRD